MDKTNLRDERLLADFFAAHQQAIPDNGFTERVMKEVSARGRIVHMRRLSLRLNILGAVGVIALFLFCRRTLALEMDSSRQPVESAQSGAEA